MKILLQKLFRKKAIASNNMLPEVKPCGWVSVDIKPTVEKEYAVMYKHGSVGKLNWWWGYWANGNVDVGYMITHWIELPSDGKV